MPIHKKNSLESTAICWISLNHEPSLYTELRLQVIDRLRCVLIGRSVLGTPATAVEFVTHMKPQRCPRSVGCIWLVGLSGSLGSTLMPMWWSLETVQWAPEDHLCTCSAHDPYVQHTTREEHSIGGPLCAPSARTDLHNRGHSAGQL